MELFRGSRIIGRTFLLSKTFLDMCLWTENSRDGHGHIVHKGGGVTPTVEDVRVRLMALL